MGQIQIIAINVDCVLIVQAVDRDFNLNRLERYLTICNASRVEPLIVLSKTDLISTTELEVIENQIRERIKDVLVITISNKNDEGYKKLESLIKAGKSYCLLGSSGVGKSTMLNALSGNIQMKTGEISSGVNKNKGKTIF